MSDSIKIDINSGTKSVLKVGFVLRAILVLSSLLSLAFLAIGFFRESPIGSLICFSLAFGLLIVIFKILSAAFLKEYVIITKNTITVFQKNASGVKNYPVEISEIISFGFSKQEYTKHV